MNKLPKHLQRSSEVDGYQRILDSFTKRGETVEWGPNGPYITTDDGHKIDVSFSFMYPRVTFTK